MANFQVGGEVISQKTITCIKDEMRTIDLWGPENTSVTPYQELDVTASPPSMVKVKRSILPIVGRTRKWEFTGLAFGTARIEAKAGLATWDWFDLDVQPGAYRFLLAEQKQFLRDLAREGKPVAAEFGFPLSAILACAAAESRFGMSDIYKTTKCPFNLQKPEGWVHPECKTQDLPTVNKEGAKAQPAPFCVANNLGHATRLFCEWVKYYPADKMTNPVAGMKGNPKLFAEKLYLVGFADNRADRTIEYGKIWENYQFARYD